MAKVQEVKKAMVALGYPESKVIYDGHFIIGIYDFERHTFVD